MRLPDICKGDQFFKDGGLVWTALSDAQPHGDDIMVNVQYSPDGGCGTRIFPANHTLTIFRPEHLTTSR